MDITVVIPTLNEEKNIGTCLKAVFNQDTNLDYEVIVSDGHSTDATVEIARKTGANVVFAERGIWRGRNAGARAGTGDVIVFIDADTIVPKNYLDVVHSVMKDRSIAAMMCGFEFSKKDVRLDTAAALLNTYFTMRYLTGKPTLSGFNLVTRRKTFERVGGFPNSHLEDGKFAEKASKYGRLVFLPEPKVITSSRRLESGGLHGALSYYLQLMLTEGMPDLLKGINPLQYKEYFPIR